MNISILVSKYRLILFYFIDALVCDVSCYVCQVVAEYIDIKIQVDISIFGFGDPLLSTSFRIPNPLAYVRQVGLVSTHKMGLYHRTLNVILRYTIPFVIDHLVFKPMRAAVNSTALGMLSVPEYGIKRSTFLLLNTDFAIETSRPITPAVKVVGPILAKLAKPLPPSLQQFIATNDRGTIIVSFGSVLSAVKILTNMQFFIDAFNRLPYNVLWKNTEKSPYHIADSVKTVQWLPQNDLLGHPKVIAFITHCGLNSILEAAYHGVPMVAIPVVADGLDHAQKVKAKNIGVILEIKKITSDILFNAIMQVTTDQNIINSAKKVSERIKNRPNNRSPVEETADWIEYALGNEGGVYLRSEEYRLNWYQLYLIDVFAIFLIFAYIALKLLKLIYAKLTLGCFK